MWRNLTPRSEITKLVFLGKAVYNVNSKLNLRCSSFLKAASSSGKRVVYVAALSHCEPEIIFPQVQASSERHSASCFPQSRVSQYPPPNSRLSRKDG